MTDRRLREILSTLRAEKLRIEELILDFQMFATESTLQKRQAGDDTASSAKKPRKPRPAFKAAGATK